MRISEVSRKYDITADTLRYYERIGLIQPVNHLAEKIEGMRHTLKRLDIKIDGYEERVLVKEEELKRTDD